MGIGNFSIRRRIYVGFGVVLALLAAELGAALRGLHRIQVLRDEISRVVDPPAAAADELERSILHRAIAARNYVATGDRLQLDEYDRALGRGRIAIDRLRHAELDEEAGEMRDAIVRAAEDHATEAHAFLGLVQRAAPADAVAAAERRVALAQQRLLDRVHALDTVQHDRQEAARQRSGELQVDVGRTVIVTAMLVALALGATAFLTVRAVRRPALALVGAAQALERGEYAPALALADDGPGSSARARRGELRPLAFAFGRMADALRRREDRLAAEGRLGVALATSLDPEATAAAALREVLTYARAALGSVYACEGDSLKLVAGLGANGSPQTLARDGLVAEALDGGHTAVAAIPADLPFTLRVGYGDVRPRTVIAVPLSSRGERVGVLMLGSVVEIERDAIAFAERAAGQLAIALQNAVSHRRLAALAAELTGSNERLQSQNEALHAHREEIQAQSAELHAQAVEIRRRNAELAAARDALAARADVLEEVDRRKDEFLATLGHELRNPLAAVAIAGHLLESGPREGDVARHASVISRQVRLLRRLVDDLLDLSRITNGELELKRERLDLRDALAKAVEAARPGIDAKGLRVAIDGGSVPAVVDADPARLEQILSNVLQNAVRYTPPGEAIPASVAVVGAEVVVRVGALHVATDLLPRIFEPFIHGAHSEGGEMGLGLGLALVRRLVELQGGNVHALAAEDGGAEIVIRLPFAPEVAPVAAPSARRDEGDMRLRVLVVEDHPDVAETTADALDLFGYSVRVARDAEAGLAACLESPPDVALLDIGLPGRNGYDLARDIRARLPRDAVRLVAVTGYGQPEDRARAMEAGFDAHLVKPVELDELRAVIERLAFEGPVGAAA